MALRFAYGIFFFYLLLLMFNHGTGARLVAEQEQGSNYISSYGHKHDAENSGYKAAYNTQEGEKDSQYEAAYGTKKEYAAAYNTEEGEKDSQYEAAYGTKKEYAAAYITQGEKDSQYEAAYGTKKEYAAAYNTQEGEKDSQYEAAYGTKKEYAAAYNTREDEKDSQHEAASCFWLSSCFTEKGYPLAYNTGKGEKYEATYGTRQRYATAYGSKQGYRAAYGTKQDPKGTLHHKDANKVKSRNTHMDRSEAFKVGLFTMDDLYVGRTMAVNFPIEEFPHFLPRKEADSIPFSTPELPNVLQLFSIPTGSPYAKSMGSTLQQCEAPSITGEIKFCATSLESMLDFVSNIMGSLTNLKLVTTTHPTMSTALTQNYTVLRISKEFFAPKWVVCHPLSFPYKVFYCHFQENTKIFKVSLGGENGQNVESVAVCHMDTSEWDPDHMIFRRLGVKPGSTPVCHFLPIYHLVWVPSTTGASI